jgi:hypothetical protein
MVWSERDADRGRNPGAAGRPGRPVLVTLRGRARPSARDGPATVLIHDKGVSESRISIDIRLLSQGDQRVIPNKALSSGFVFRHETLRSAFEANL